MLSVSLDPPNKYGMVQFEGGGRFMADFTDCDPDELKVGLPMRMVFRRRYVDKERGFTNYFWKATPDREAMLEMDKIRFDGQVAVVTGAGGGLGKVYALELAKLGAKVVVNDLGGSRDGTGADATPAQKVVDEIVAAGGEAVANYDNVATPEGGENIIKAAVDKFGTVDIVINNAGILRDKSFMKMEPENWNAVLAVHLNGSYNVTRAAWPILREKGYGRVVMTTSAAGLYGNFGQTNYSAAKMALVGLANTLAIEGAKYNIKVNTIAPLAASRLTEDVMPPEVFEKSKPEYVSPMVLYLCSDQCQVSGDVFCAGMGYYQRAEIMTGQAIKLGEEGKAPTVEDIEDAWDAINSLEGAKDISDATSALMALAEAKPPGAKEAAPAPEQAPAAGGGGEVSVDEVFEMMPQFFNADKAAGVNVVFQYEIEGPGGGDWAVTVADGECKVEKKKADSPTTTLKMSAADFIGISLGKLNPMQLYTSGKLKIEGDIMKSQLIEKLFSPPK
ncbi:MAG: SDR family NAD(P)-dependent oxidoreductase, partial [Deltaproteobacteria bacterium]|nr:SDR family NAD(P)-dependent oxidoreductase [Deltaproteobacteria bacterium]